MEARVRGLLSNALMPFRSSWLWDWSEGSPLVTTGPLARNKIPDEYDRCYVALGASDQACTSSDSFLHKVEAGRFAEWKEKIEHIVAKTESTIIHQYTDGHCRIIMANDGTKPCLAMLLTEEMVGNITDVLNKSRKVERIEAKREEADQEHRRAETKIELLTEDLSECEALPAPQDAHKTEQLTNQLANIIEEIAQTNSVLPGLLEKKELLEENLKVEKRNLAYLNDELQDLLRDVLTESQLLTSNDTEDEENGEGEDKSDNKKVRGHTATGSLISNDTLPSIDELNRRASYHDIGKSREWLELLQDKFDTRYDFYGRDLAEYQQAVEDGFCDLAQSEFDRIFIRNTSRLTRRLVDAEAAHIEAKTSARALGVTGNDYALGSDFVSDVDDGYRESFEAETAACVDRSFIEAWIDAVKAHRHDLPDTPREDPCDNWDACSVEIWESVSVVAEGNMRNKIDEWHCQCCGAWNRSDDCVRESDGLSEPISEG
ncbi:MAG: hypothetical protein M1827_007155 [Pycnora praestabilis]|nr:MAG: hypothetical protein M1827_007155 [Pycnora praestabilis]